MDFINLYNLTDFPEDLILAKVKIEKELLENNVINDRFKINEFINWLDFSKNIYVEDNNTIPFSIRNGKDFNYMFFIPSSNNEKHINKMMSILKSINYDMTNLKKVSMGDLYMKGIDFPENEYFIINSQIYTL
jgi:hypothetical protein